MIDIETILGIVIIIVGVITLIRIIKPLFEGVVVIAVIIIGSALLFHSSPLSFIPNFSLPINVGPNIVGANQGTGNTTDVAVFNAYTFSIGSFSATLNGKPVSILNDNVLISPAKVGVLVLNSSESGRISLSGKSDLFGFEVGSVSTSFNYTAS